MFSDPFFVEADLHMRLRHQHRVPREASECVVRTGVRKLLLLVREYGKCGAALGKYSHNRVFPDFTGRYVYNLLRIA